MIVDEWRTVHQIKTLYLFKKRRPLVVNVQLLFSVPRSSDGSHRRPLALSTGRRGHIAIAHCTYFNVDYLIPNNWIDASMYLQKIFANTWRTGFNLPVSEMSLLKRTGHLFNRWASENETRSINDECKSIKSEYKSTRSTKQHRVNMLNVKKYKYIYPSTVLRCSYFTSVFVLIHLLIIQYFYFISESRFLT